MTAALEGGEWSAARPGRTLPPGKTRYPLYRMMGGPQDRSGRAENLVPTGSRSRTVQPVFATILTEVPDPQIAHVAQTKARYSIIFACNILHSSYMFRLYYPAIVRELAPQHTDVYRGQFYCRMF